MRRSRWITLAFLFLLLPVSSWALAPDTPPDLATLLASMEDPASLSPAEEKLPDTPPEPLFMACNATSLRNCPLAGGGSTGSPVTCAGNSTCIAGDYVSCDGVVTSCACYAFSYDPDCYCECLETGGTGIYCRRTCGP